MIVGVCHTKTPHMIYENFIEGLKLYGDTYYDVVETYRDWRKVLDMCDVSMQICEGHSRSKEGSVRGNGFRTMIQEHQNKRKKRRLVFETGFIKNDSVSDEAYYQVGYDGMKRKSLCYEKQSPSDRWRALGIKEKPWRKSGEHILIMAQNLEGAGACHLDLKSWWRDTIQKIKTYTDRPIKVRLHPRARVSFPKKIDVEILNKNTTIEDDLKNCWCSIVRTSNSCVDSIINGIPVITPDQMCMSYDISSHSIDEIESPLMPDRSQWLNNLAYCQWSISEIKRGLPWGRLRRYASET